MRNDSIDLRLSEYLTAKKLRQKKQRLAREADLAQRIQSFMNGTASSMSVTPKRVEKFSIPSPATLPLFSVSSPFSSATPNPAYQWDAILNQPASGVDDINLQSLADPNTGRVSLGLMGGNFPAGWSAPAFFIPMRGRWLLGDQTGISASVFTDQNLNIGGTSPPFPVGATDLIITASLFNPLTNIDSMMQTNLGTAMLIWPGKSTSSAHGLVAAQGYFTLTANLQLGSEFITSNSTSITFLERVAYQPDPDAVPDSNPGVVISNSWLFGPSQLVDAVVVLPFTPDVARRSAYSVLVEAEVGIAAMRGGVDDPNGGMIKLAFQDISPVFPRMTPLPYYPDPFNIMLVTAALTQL